MHEFLDRITAYIHWALFLFLEVLSGFMLFQYNRYQGSVWLTQANTVTATVLEWRAMLMQYVNLPEENTRLVRANIELQDELDQLRHELSEARRDTLRQPLRPRILQGQRLVPALVIDNSVRQRDNFMTINVGSADGVEPEMGVISGTGVVGIVSKVTPHHALVMSILNSHSSISCRLRGTEYFGYMKWKGGKPLRASMDDVPRHARIHKGDIVETSGFSSVFPAGIFLGKVAQVHNSSDGLAYELEITLGTDIACLRNVSVILHDDKAELDSLSRQ